MSASTSPKYAGEKLTKEFPLYLDETPTEQSTLGLLPPRVKPAPCKNLPFYRSHNCRFEAGVKRFSNSRCKAVLYHLPAWTLSVKKIFIFFPRQLSFEKKYESPHLKTKAPSDAEQIPYFRQLHKPGSK